MPRHLPGLLCVAILWTALPAQAETPKERFDRITSYINEGCVPQKKTFQNLEYQLCQMEDIPTRVTMQGPPGDNGPTAYFYGGKLFAFRETGQGEAQIFEDGKLVAQIQVGTVAPDYNTIKTTFSTAERKQLTERAKTSSTAMLRVFGLKPLGQKRTVEEVALAHLNSDKTALEAMVNRKAMVDRFVLMGWNRGEMGGTILLEKKEKTWKVLSAGGGWIGLRGITAQGVSRRTAEQLLTQYDSNWRSYEP
jgi:hypothetical protein